MFHGKFYEKRDGSERAKQYFGIVDDGEKRDDVLKIFQTEFGACGVHGISRRGLGTRHHANAARRAGRFVSFIHGRHVLPKASTMCKRTHAHASGEAGTLGALGQCCLGLNASAPQQRVVGGQGPRETHAGASEPVPDDYSAKASAG